MPNFLLVSSQVLIGTCVTLHSPRTLKIGTFQSLNPNSNVVRIWQFQANPKSDRFTDSFTSYSDLPFVAWSSHSSFPSIICRTEVNKYTLNGYFFDVCIILNAKWDWAVSSDLEFNIMQTSINSYSMEQAVIARQIQIRQIWSTESESDRSGF